MANIYVRSTDGSDADNGSTWALAKATLTGAAAIDAAGDTVFVAETHAESAASAVTLAFAGAAANPSKAICANSAAEPPTAVATTGTVTTTGASAITITGSVHAYGLTFNTGTGASAANLQLNNTSGHYQKFEKCTLKLLTTSSSSRIVNAVSATADNSTEFLNTYVSFGAASQGISLLGASFTWNGGGLLAGTSSPTTGLLSFLRSAASCVVQNVDLSQGGTGLVLTTGTASAVRALFVNCKLPAGWTGSVIGGSISTGSRVEVVNCDSADTNYRLWVEDYAGTILDETTLVMTGGATDGTTPIAWKMVASAAANELTTPLVSPGMPVWNETTGSAKTATVEILHDSATNLTDAEVYLEVVYLGTAGFPLGSVASDQRATPLTTAADQTASLKTWTTTGMTNPNKQKLNVTFTPQEKGWFVGRVLLCKASKTIYVDCELTVS